MFIGIEADHANKVERTGVEEYRWQIIQHLKKIMPSHQRVVLYSRGPLLGELGDLPPNWESRVLSWRRKKLWSQVRLSFELLVHSPDVFFAPGQLIPFLCPKNTVAMVHDSAFLAHPEAYNFWGRQYLKWMNKRIVQQAKAIITSTEFNKREILKYYSVDESKIRVVPLAYDDLRFRQQQVSPLLGEGWGEEYVKWSNIAVILNKYSINKPFLFFVGRLEHKKNVARIVQAFSRLKHARAGNEKIKNLQLVLAGRLGVGYGRIKSAIADSFYKSDVRLLGWVESGDLPHLLNAAAAFIFPSLYEGFGIPILEAMACGCPVVASVGSALLEVGGEAALYANPLDADDIASEIFRLLTNEENRKEMVEKGLERVKIFSWEKTAAAIALILSSVNQDYPDINVVKVVGFWYNGKG